MNDESGHSITKLIDALSDAGSDQAEIAKQLFTVVQTELRKLAGDLMRRERLDHTLQPTALVNEAYLRLFQGSNLQWENRAHFFGTAARAMRQILIDHARARQADKRGGGWERMTLDSELALVEPPDIDIIDLDRLLTKLHEVDARMEQVVELRVFAGMTVPEVAHILGVAERTIFNDWRVARMWLRRELARESDS